MSTAANHRKRRHRSEARHGYAAEARKWNQIGRQRAYRPESVGFWSRMLPGLFRGGRIATGARRPRNDKSGLETVLAEVAE